MPDALRSGEIMRVAVGSDHAGYELKRVLADYLAGVGHEVTDLGTDSTSPVDYPVFAEKVGLAVTGGAAERGIVICGSGVGASVASNKIPGVRAGLCHDIYSAHQGVEHDDINVLVIGSRVVGEEVAKDLARTFLEARFTNEDRHRRRLALVAAIERRHRGTNS